MNNRHQISAPGLLILGLPLLVAFQLSIHPLLMHLPGAVVSMLAEPFHATSKIVPGLILGWLARSNPVPWAALAAVLGSLVCNFVVAGGYEPFSLVGASISAAMYVGLASAVPWVARDRFAQTDRSNGLDSVATERQR